MDTSQKMANSLFEVYLRLRPSVKPDVERFLDVEDCEHTPTHIIVRPPATDSRKRAVEKFAFTRVFEEDAAQLDLFKGTGVLDLLDAVLGADGCNGRDSLLATLGVTGSGKSHTILGSKTQRGLTQLALDVLYRSTKDLLVPTSLTAGTFESLASGDVAEAQILSASVFLESLYGDGLPDRGLGSRAQTPMPDGGSFLCVPKRYLPQPSMLAQAPNVEDISLPVDGGAEYAILVSMYEVYNDRIFDLLTTASMTKNYTHKRRALLFKPTERSPDRKVVAGLRKIVCSTRDEALMVLEAGLTERRVAGTGSNAVSSRSHGFFCVEVKKRAMGSEGSWSGSTLTIVDLAGSERARNAKTAGATLAEAGKINESLMYLGQCMQMQSDNQDSTKQNLVPFRQCKLTELLFSNSFQSPSGPNHLGHHHHHHQAHHNPQKAIMIVTVDARGDFNATSQMLRYSALAREVTVPRIASTSSQILAGTIAASSYRQAPNCNVSSAQSQEELEQATQEIWRLSEEMEILQLQLREEKSRRRAAEASWRAAEERMQDMEREVREECHEQMEASLEEERRRWKGAWGQEADHNDERLDKKIEILTRGIHIYEDEAPGDETRVIQLEDENDSLKAKISNLERERENQKSPTKKQRVLKAKKWEADYELDGRSFS